MLGLDSVEGKAISANVQEQETTADEELKKAPSNEENKDTFMNEDAEEHDGTSQTSLRRLLPS